MQTDFAHQPVLLQEALAQLAICETGYYVDATFGRGGHSQAILKKLGKAGQLLAIDQDATAIAHAKSSLNDSRFAIKQGNFANIKTLITEHGWHDGVNGILFDLGVSSPQLDDATRGFSFLRDGPLDMRMNNSHGITAAEWLAKICEKQLAKTLFQGGEERFSRRVARAIIAARQVAPITRTVQLAKIIADAIPKRQPGKHPATQSFQAIRIAINQEFEVLPIALKNAISCLVDKGRICVITFHSLEDQIVKQVFRAAIFAAIAGGNCRLRYKNPRSLCFSRAL